MSFRAFVVDKDGDDIRTGSPTSARTSSATIPCSSTWSGRRSTSRTRWSSRPNNRVARRFPLVAGIDLAGTVAVGAGGIEAGTAVLAHGYDLGVAHHGGFAERARVPAEWVVPLPRRRDGTPRGHRRDGRVHRGPLVSPAGGQRNRARSTAPCS